MMVIRLMRDVQRLEVVMFQEIKRKIGVVGAEVDR
jgi:hypothetical protein